MAERLSVAQDVEGSIPSSRPKTPSASAPLPGRPPGQIRELTRVSVTQQTTENTTIGETHLRHAGWFTPFEPRRGLANGHLQTIVGNFLSRPALKVATEAEEVEVDPADGSRVLCHLNWQPEPRRAGSLTLVMVHGLEGSSDSVYMRGIAARAWDAGFNVVRMNMRNCGDTDTLTPTLYHSGFSGDVGAVVEHFRARWGLERVALVGYSMGGNLVLKLAGEWGNRAPLVAVAAVCPVIDLAPSSDALHQPKNRMYEWRFLRGLMRRFHRKAALFPDRYEPDGVGPVRSLREFDNKIVARYCGFKDADDYYYRVASARVVDRIDVPTLIISAMDDPFIRMFAETRKLIEANPMIEFVETRTAGTAPFFRATRAKKATGPRPPWFATFKQ